MTLCSSSDGVSARLIQTTADRLFPVTLPCTIVQSPASDQTSYSPSYQRLPWAARIEIGALGEVSGGVISAEASGAIVNAAAMMIKAKTRRDSARRRDAFGDSRAQWRMTRRSSSLCFRISASLPNMQCVVPAMCGRGPLHSLLPHEARMVLHTTNVPTPTMNLERILPLKKR